MGAAEIASTAAGAVLLPIVFYDLFQTVVLPRPAARKFQLARYIIRPMWTVWRWVALRSSRVDRSETRLAAFGPVALIVLVLIWAFALILGYGLILSGHTHGGQVRLPFVGALVTNSQVPTKLAMGLSRLGPAVLHVSPGLGTSKFAPFRFLCRPEATVLELVSGPET